LRPASTNTFESLSLRSRVRSTNSTPLTSQASTYLEAWRATHKDAEPSPEATAVDEYLRSKPDPRALRSHLQELILRRPGTWLASPFPQYPSPTGDRAGAWKRVFPELVAPDNDVLERQVAFEALLQLFEGTPDQKEFHQRLARHANPGMLIRACRNPLLSGAVRKSLLPFTSQRLSELEKDASRRGLEATAAVLALHAHLLENRGLPEPRTFSEVLRDSAADATAAQRAQYHAARLLAKIWPPLSISGVESPRMHDVLSHDPAFTGLRLPNSFGITPSTLEQQTAAVLSLMPPGSPELALGGQPPRLIMAGLGDTATWGEQDGPELRDQIARVRAARQAEAEGIKNAGWARRLYNPEGYERQLAELRGESIPAIRSTTVAQAQRGQAVLEQQRDQRIRDGVYVARDPNRYDRVFTREVNSFERREMDFRVDVQRYEVERARSNEEYNQRMMADHYARENAIIDQLNDAYRAIQSTEREWAPKLKALRARVESEEAKLRRIRGVGVPAAEIEANHDAIRIAELKRHRAERIAALRAWESTGAEVSTAEAGAERLWRRWLTTGREPEYVPQVIGGLPLP
jgi:hypothetical protein